MNKTLRLFICCVCVLCVRAYLFGDEAYQVPQTIYIGDMGRLVYPLDGFFFQQKDGKLPLDSVLENGAKRADIIINNIEIKEGHLIVDFQVFKTGEITLPAINIAGERLDSLKVYVASLIENSAATTLSPFAPPMNAPGTLWLIISFIFIFIIILAFLLIFIFYGGSFFTDLRLNFVKMHIIHLTLKSIKKLRLALKKGGIPAQSALAGIINELRIFLEKYFHINCRSMVPVEFLNIKLPLKKELEGRYSSRYFYNFFMRCDTMRFSGNVISENTVFAIIDEVENFVNAVKLSDLNRAKKTEEVHK